MRKLILLFLTLSLFCTNFLLAQAPAANAPVEMADTMHSNGKIFVVVGVVAIILFGLLTYLISIDRKIGKIEKEIEEQKKK